MANDYVTVKVQGLDQLQKNMEALPAKVAKKGLRQALKKGGLVMRDAMVTLAPKDTGFLAEHFNMRMGIRRDELAGQIYIGPQGKIDYPAYASGAYNIRRRANGKIKKAGRIAVATVARFLEFGTSKMAKRPFMTQAFESYKEKALEMITQALTEVFGELD
jgi:HK97 gp10 family phage protein